MSQPVVLTTKHQLGVEGVKQRVDERFETLKADGMLAKVADVQMSWAGDTANVRAKALGQSIRGTVAVAEHDLTRSGKDAANPARRPSAGMTVRDA